MPPLLHNKIKNGSDNTTAFRWLKKRTSPFYSKVPLSVGLLTHMFRYCSVPTYILRLPGRAITAASDLLSQKKDVLHAYSY